MSYSVYQHWDPLEVCIVGRSYSPEFYSFIKNPRVRSVMERIAQETEEDYQKLISLLTKFDVKVLRPRVVDNYKLYGLTPGQKIPPPPMTPRDYSIMLGNDFFFSAKSKFAQMANSWEIFRGADWPIDPPRTVEECEALPEFVKKELASLVGDPSSLIIHPDLFPNCDPDPSLDYLEMTYKFDHYNKFIWGQVVDDISKYANVYNNVPWFLHEFNSASTTRIGKDIYLGTSFYGQNNTRQLDALHKKYPNYRWHSVDTGGHLDGTFCPVKPGLIVSLYDIPTYAETFPDWEVIYLPGQSWDRVKPFLELKNKNKGKWWVPGEELNDEFTDFVESWLGNWVGYVEETVFDVNMLVIDEKNVICNNYNEEVFKAFDRHGVTPHVVNFRHRYFWDGGLHCITSDVSRRGTMNNYFPERD